MLAIETHGKSSLRAGGFTLFAALIFFPFTALGQWGDQVERISESLISGLYHDVEISAGRAYCAMGYGLAVFDVTNPAQIRWLSYYGVPGQTEGLCLDATYAYLTSGSGGIHIIDVSNPALPECVGSLSLPGYAYETVKGGDFLYVAAGAAGLRVVDVSQPGNPHEVAGLSLGGWAMDLQLDNGLLYVAAGSAGLKVVSVAEPSQPQVISSYDTTGDAQGVCKVDCLLYIADGSGGVIILNVNSPAQPFWVSQWATGGIAHQAEISGSYLYVADDAVGLVALNVSNPQIPYQVGSFNSRGLAWSLAIVGQTLYLADNDQGLLTFSLANPVIPVPLGEYSDPGEVVGIWVGGGYAYTAGGIFKKITIQDVSNPALPLTVSQMSFHDPVVGLNVQNNICYTAHLTGGVGLTDVTNPQQPHYLERRNTEGETYDMAAQPPLIYVADGSEGLVFLATQPDTAWHLPISGSARSLLKRTDTIYVCQWNSGVALVDVSPPTTPQLLAQYDTPGLAHCCAAFGDYIYVADDFEGLTILRNGTLTGNYPTAGDLWDVKVSGRRAFLAAGYAGLIILDVTNPSAPVYAGSYRTPGLAQEVFLEGEYIYVADQYCLGIYRFTGSGVTPAPPPIPHSFSVSVHPNPFNTSTVISYELRAASGVKLKVYDTAGSLVSALVDGRREAGKHQVTFDGSGLASGIYIYTLTTKEFKAAGKMVLLK